MTSLVENQKSDNEFRVTCNFGSVKLMMEQLHALVEPRIAKSKLIRVLRWSTFLARVSILATLPIFLNTQQQFISMYHRMLFVLCIGDIIYSVTVSQAHFNAASLKDMNYAVLMAFSNSKRYYLQPI